MTQEIITYIIIIFAFSFTAFKLVKMLLPQKKVAKGGCASCSSGSGCGIPKKTVTQHQYSKLS